jgi:predicted acetyltransferase
MASMTFRQIQTDDEWAQHTWISAYSFDGDRGDEARERRTQVYERDWCYGAFDGDTLVAGLAILPFGEYLHGASIPCGGIASVSCLPERRREGYVGGLLRHSLEVMRDAGQPLSALYTPHYSLYRKYGWEIASRIISYSFPPKAAGLRLTTPRDGAYHRISAGEWSRLEAMYGAFHASRNGALARPEKWWRSNVLQTYGKTPHDVVVWSNSDGEDRGYAVYKSVHNRPTADEPWGSMTIRVVDWIALDADAYAAILAYFLSHDQHSRVVMLASQDEPLYEAFEEPYHVEPRAWDGIMLRLVDVQTAIEARPALPQASGNGVTIALSDAAAPWNAGSWHIESSEGRMSAERTNAAPELEMDVRALASLYNGFVKPIDAVRVGQVRVLTDHALPAATDLFSVAYAPFCPDDF